MSRNIGSVICRLCDSHVFQTGPWHRWYEFDSILSFVQRAGLPDSEYEGIRFCNARCCECGTPYIGWGNHREMPFDGDIVDLSYRSSFNDEPGDADCLTARYKTPQEKQAAALLLESESVKETK